jgi:outer membrane protein assembly factor BamB
VWVTGGEGGRRVLRVDPRTNRVAAKIPIPGGFQLWNVAADGRWVWRENVDGTMWRIDAASNRATRLRATVRWATTLMAPGSLVTGDGMVWAGSDQELVRLDPTTGRPFGRVTGTREPLSASTPPRYRTAWNTMTSVKCSPSSCQA